MNVCRVAGGTGWVHLGLHLGHLQDLTELSEVHNLAGESENGHVRLLIVVRQQFYQQSETRRRMARNRGPKKGFSYNLFLADLLVGLVIKALFDGGEGDVPVVHGYIWTETETENKKGRG